MTSQYFHIEDANIENRMGYGGTDAPESPSFYTYKRAADDIAALAKKLGLSSIILGGHDCEYL
jgi:soluble epoxide hydrolase/lipid-phosphate phosphatase